MNIIICLDDNLANQFNGRRQSSDIKIIEDIVKNCGQNLYIEKYSQELFDKLGYNNYKIDENMFTLAGKDDFCFVELNNKYKNHLVNIEKIIVYKFNRNYPFEKKININFDEYMLIEITDFKGNSHDKITKETYLKNEE